MSFRQVPRYHRGGYFPDSTANQNRRTNPTNYRKEPMEASNDENWKSNNKPNQRYNSYGPRAPKQLLIRNRPNNYEIGGRNSNNTPIKDNGKPRYISNNRNNGNVMMMNHHHRQGSGNNPQPVEREPMYATPEMPYGMMLPQPMPTQSPYVPCIPLVCRTQLDFSLYSSTETIL